MLSIHKKTLDEYGSRHTKVFCKITVLKSFSKLTRKHTCDGVFSIKLQAQTKISIFYRTSPVTTSVFKVYDEDVSVTWFLKGFVLFFFNLEYIQHLNLLFFRLSVSGSSVKKLDHKRPSYTSHSEKMLSFGNPV